VVFMSWPGCDSLGEVPFTVDTNKCRITPTTTGQLCMSLTRAVPVSRLIPVANPCQISRHAVSGTETSISMLRSTTSNTGLTSECDRGA
jgi:hypothetical protein